MATTDGTTTGSGGDDDPAVLGAPEYLGTQRSDPGRGGRNTAWLVAAALVVVLVLGVAIVAVTRSPDESATPSSTTTTVPAPADDAVPQEIDAGAPYDGKASMRLPITVSPNRDLVDGQEVTVSGTGFPPGADLGVIMCTNDAVFAGIAACDIGTAMSSISMTNSKITADANGSFSVQYRVRLHFRVADPDAVPVPPTTTRYVDPSGNVVYGSSGSVAPMRDIDCTAGDIDPDVWPNVIPPTAESDPGGFTCIIAAGMVTDYDKSGGAAIGAAGSQFRTFDPSETHAAPTVAPPTTAAPDATTTSLVGATPTSATSTPPVVVTGVTTTTVATGPTNPPGTGRPPQQP